MVNYESNFFLYGSVTMANGDMLTEREEYESIERVMDSCDDCEMVDKCREYCEQAQKVRDGNVD